MKCFPTPKNDNFMMNMVKMVCVKADSILLMLQVFSNNSLDRLVLHLVHVEIKEGKTSPNNDKGIFFVVFHVTTSSFSNLNNELKFSSSKTIRLIKFKDNRLFSSRFHSSVLNSQNKTTWDFWTDLEF